MKVVTVADILEGKGSDVISTTPEATLADICQLLTTHRIGAALVLDAAGKMVGLVSERDIVNGIATKGLNILGAKVAEIMTEKVFTCRPDSPVDAVKHGMTEHRFRHMPVMEDGEIKGMVSIGDLVKTRISELEDEANFMREYIQTGG